MNHTHASETLVDKHLPADTSNPSKTIEKGLMTMSEPADNVQAAIAFFHAGKYHKCLEYTKRAGANASAELFQCAIQSAFKLSQYHLVWDYFLALTPAQREKCDYSLLALVANAAMRLEKFHEAEKILNLVKLRIKAPDLPSFEEVIRTHIGTAAQVDAFIKEMKGKKPEIRKQNPADLKPWIDYSLALFTKGKYQDAVEMLHTVRYQYAGQ